MTLLHAPRQSGKPSLSDVPAEQAPELANEVGGSANPLELTDAHKAVLRTLRNDGASFIDDDALAHSLDVLGLIKPGPGPSKRWMLTTDGVAFVRGGGAS